VACVFPQKKSMRKEEEEKKRRNREKKIDRGRVIASSDK